MCVYINLLLARPDSIIDNIYSSLEDFGMFLSLELFQNCSDDIYSILTSSFVILYMVSLICRQSSF